MVLELSLTRAKRASARRTGGQGLIEFALVLPILLLLLFGVIDFGWMLFNYVSLYNGLREGARFASVSGYTSTAQYYQCDNIRKEIMTRALFSGIQPGNITITYDNGNPGAAAVGTCPVGSTGSVALNNGYRVVIDVSVNVKFITPFIQTFARGGMTINLRSARTVFPNGF